MSLRLPFGFLTKQFKACSIASYLVSLLVVPLLQDQLILCGPVKIRIRPCLAEELYSVSSSPHD